MRGDTRGIKLNKRVYIFKGGNFSFFSPGGRKPPEERPATRRLSFRVVKPYEVGAEDESMMNLEASTVPVVSPKVVPPPVLGPDEERRTRRRGSQL